MAITPCYIQVCLIGRDDAELAEMLEAPLVKAFLLQVSAEMLGKFGYEHPMGENWRGYQDIDPGDADPRAHHRVPRQGRPRIDPAPSSRTARPSRSHEVIYDYVDAGLRVPKIMDYGAMAGLTYAAASADNVREAEDELMRLCGDVQ